MRAKSIRIKGRVQGVFYRATAHMQAMTLGVTGWARNNPDGSVEIHAEGEPEALEAFTDWCRKGPEGAEVQSVEITDAKAENSPSFEIIR